MSINGKTAKDIETPRDDGDFDAGESADLYLATPEKDDHWARELKMETDHILEDDDEANTTITLLIVIRMNPMYERN